MFAATLSDPQVELSLTVGSWFSVPAQEQAVILPKARAS